MSTTYKMMLLYLIILNEKNIENETNLGHQPFTNIQ